MILECIWKYSSRDFRAQLQRHHKAAVNAFWRTIVSTLGSHTNLLLLALIPLVVCGACAPPDKAQERPKMQTHWLWYRPNGDKPGVGVFVIAQGDRVASAIFAAIEPESSVTDVPKSVTQITPIRLLRSDGMSFDGEFVDPETDKRVRVSVSEWKNLSTSESRASVVVNWADAKDEGKKVMATFVQSAAPSAERRVKDK